MKKIIIGQLMMWANMASIVLGYLILKNIASESEYLTGLLGFVGVIGSCANLFFSIVLQIDGYQDLKVLSRL